jgi:RNA polymerase sigma factor (TIGR02999 family)
VTVGDPLGHAAADLLPLVYDELRRLAHQKMSREPAGRTLQATSLVHEAYLRLVANGDPRWQNRTHFFSAAAEAMRRILIERGRRYGRLKHGARRPRVALEESAVVARAPAVDMTALDDALSRLEAIDRRKGDVVKLRYFAGLSIEETAQALGVSPATVKSDWNYAKAWLHREMTA